MSAVFRGTLLELITELTKRGDTAADETILRMMSSGEIELTGNFRGLEYTFVEHN